MTQIAVFHQAIEQTAPWQFEIRNLRLLFVYVRFRLRPGDLSPDVKMRFRPAVFATEPYPKFADFRISDPISKGLDLPEIHWTSPLGPLASGMGVGLRHGAKHSLPGASGSKVRSKKSKFMKSIISTAHRHFR